MDQWTDQGLISVHVNDLIALGKTEVRVSAFIKRDFASETVDQDNQGIQEPIRNRALYLLGMILRQLPDQMICVRWHEAITDSGPGSQTYFVVTIHLARLGQQ